mmetsp:Transcript_11597/g.25065  ORF Transcript_11597/g.25065 Transcript_11597/m.25065 type:complete len:213 (+) Transcript_11597:76-714(+)
MMLTVDKRVRERERAVSNERSAGPTQKKDTTRCEQLPQKSRQRDDLVGIAGAFKLPKQTGGPGLVLDRDVDLTTFLKRERAAHGVLLDELLARKLHGAERLIRAPRLVLDHDLNGEVVITTQALGLFQPPLRVTRVLLRLALDRKPVLRPDQLVLHHVHTQVRVRVIRKPPCLRNLHRQLPLHRKPTHLSSLSLSRPLLSCSCALSLLCSRR